MLAQADFITLHPDTAEPARFCLQLSAGSGTRGLVVHVAPFAEELNKTRRMVSQQARRLAAAGFSVLLPDLLGCGDSPGHFEDATWADWQRDVTASAAWLRRQHPERDLPLWLWGTRLGGLLAAECAAACQAQGLLLWQPVLDGSKHLQQFLRIADTQTGPLAASHSAQVRAALRLEAGASVDVAGYRITPALARGMHGARAPAATCPVICVQQRPAQGWAPWPTGLPGTPGASAAVPAPRMLEASGPAFWNQVEAEDAADWWSVTTQAMVDGLG
jgi:exosortase A-associated hydrolase 2